MIHQEAIDVIKTDLIKDHIHLLQRGDRIILFNPYNLKKVFTRKSQLEADIKKNTEVLTRKAEIPKPILSNIKAIVTTGCNFRCQYCLVYKNRKNIQTEHMSREIADDLITFYNEKVKQGHLVLTGGEPLTNWVIVKYLIENMNAKSNIIQTNGALITEEIAKFFKEKEVLVILSLDGDDEAKNAMRKNADGSEAYAQILKGYNIAKKAGCSVGVSVVAGPHNVNELSSMTANLRLNFDADSFGYNLPHYTKYNDSNVDIDKYTSELIKIFHLAKKEKFYVDQIARKLKPIIMEKFRIMDCTAAGEQILFFPDGSYTNCINYPPFKRNYEVNRWEKRIPIRKKFCKDCLAIGACGGGCLFDGIKRYAEGLDLRNCKFTKDIVTTILWDMYDELEKHDYDYDALFEVYKPVIGYNSTTGVSAGHETTNLSLKVME